jgi:hypothetical protein
MIDRAGVDRPLENEMRPLVKGGARGLTDSMRHVADAIDEDLTLEW